MLKSEQITGLYDRWGRAIPLESPGLVNFNNYSPEQRIAFAKILQAIALAEEFRHNQKNPFNRHPFLTEKDMIAITHDVVERLLILATDKDRNGKHMEP